MIRYIPLCTTDNEDKDRVSAKIHHVTVALLYCDTRTAEIAREIFGTCPKAVISSQIRLD